MNLLKITHPSLLSYFRTSTRSILFPTPLVAGRQVGIQSPVHGGAKSAQEIRIIPLLASFDVSGEPVEVFVYGVILKHMLRHSFGICSAKRTSVAPSPTKTMKK